LRQGDASVCLELSERGEMKVQHGKLITTNMFLARCSGRNEIN
jgi:hypothetical protein